MEEPRIFGIKLSELENPKVITKQQTNLILSAVLTEKGVRKWWTKKMDKLGGDTPEKAWKEGQKRRVYDIALGYLDTSYS